EIQTTLAGLGPTLEIQLERLLNQAKLTDPMTVAALNILEQSQIAAFHHNPKLLFLLQAAGIKLSVQHGLSVATPQLFAVYANHLCSRGDIETGYQIGQFVVKLGECRDTFALAIARLTINSLVRPWREHIRHVLPDLLEDYQRSLESGQLFGAGASLQVYCHRLLIVGGNLAQLEQEMALYGSILQRLKQVRTLELHQIRWQFVLNLRGQARIPWQLKGKLFDLETRRTQWLEIKNFIGLADLYGIQYRLSYLFQRFPEAGEQATMAEPYLNTGTIGPHTSTFYLYDSLIRLAIYLDVSAEEQQQILKKVTAHQEKMKQWPGTPR
ncbi:MAG: hypothetical protein GY934_10265, partial [Gammaproteobacteria bacterium]|nr:hypothetical protein [Gammaproteobacteria bacterium]